MTTSRFAKSAVIKHVLVYYDGPQLLYLETDRGFPMMAVAVSRNGMVYPFFAAEIIGNQIEKYLQGKVDLHFIFRTTPISRLYIFDLAKAHDDQVVLERATPADRSNEKLYPEVGIFSRSHTHPLVDEQQKEEGPQKFLIDGVWEASDFSRFYGKIADTYSLTYVSQSLSTEAVTESDRVFLHDSITERNWQGGGSYGSFYGNVRTRVRSRHPLQVDAIEYHSPGYIQVIGSKSVLAAVIVAIGRAITDNENIGKIYKSVYQILRKENLLGADKEREFSSDSIAKFAHSQTLRLAGAVGLPNPESVFFACENNDVIFAKVVMSYARRVRELARFYVEGRVQTG